MSHEREHADDREAAPAPAGPATDDRAGRPTTAPPGPSMTAIARQPPAIRAAMIARLQQTGGNRAVVARIEDDALAGPEIVKGWRQEADEKVKIDLGSASEPEKLAEIQRLLGDAMPKSGSGDADTSGWGISRVWKSFGERMWEVALANRKLFETSMQRAARPHLLRGRLGRHARALQERRRGPRPRQPRREPLLRLQRDGGARHPLAAAGRRAPAGDRADRGLREMQIAAERVAKAQEGMARTRSIPVGTKNEVYGHGPGRLHGRGDGLLRPGEAAGDAGRPGQPGLGGGQEGVRQARPLHQAGDGPVARAVRAGGEAAGRARPSSPACRPRRRARSSSRSCRR